MSMLGTKTPVYKDGRVKQSFKDETDINKILERANKSGTISHLNKHRGEYADFSDFDFFEAQLMLTKGREIFDDLPAEVRSEFNQSQADFFEYVNDPKNVDRLDELLPALAAPGRQNIDVSGKNLADGVSEPGASAKAKPSTEVADGTKGPVDPPQDPPGGEIVKSADAGQLSNT